MTSAGNAPTTTALIASSHAEAMAAIHAGLLAGAPTEETRMHAKHAEVLSNAQQALTQSLLEKEMAENKFLRQTNELRDMREAMKKAGVSLSGSSPAPPRTAGFQGEPIDVDAEEPPPRRPTPYQRPRVNPNAYRMDDDDVRQYDMQDGDSRRKFTFDGTLEGYQVAKQLAEGTHNYMTSDTYKQVVKHVFSLCTENQVAMMKGTVDGITVRYQREAEAQHRRYEVNRVTGERFPVTGGGFKETIWYRSCRDRARSVAMRKFARRLRERQATAPEVAGAVPAAAPAAPAAPAAAEEGSEPVPVVVPEQDGAGALNELD